MDILNDIAVDLGLGSGTPAPMAAAAPTPGPLDQLQAAISAAAPRADAAAWASALAGPMRSSGMVTARRIAAFLGQVAVESAAFSTLSEDLVYSTASRIFEVFPSHFESEADAEGYVRDAEALANRVYAGQLGNGDEASGDGWAFRGSGLIQVTGRTAHTAFAAAVGKDISTSPDWCRTPEGAATSACWWWSTQASGMNSLADAWEISNITRRVNGPSMLGNAQRIAFSNAALKALS